MKRLVPLLIAVVSIVNALVLASPVRATGTKVPAIAPPIEFTPPSTKPGTGVIPQQFGDMSPLEVIPGTHRCENFGSTVSGYRAGHCADIDVFVNSLGFWAYRGQGQAFCQVASTEQIVQCAGVSQTVAIAAYDASSGALLDYAYTLHDCGRFTEPWHNPACPAGRFQNLSPGLYAQCAIDYFAFVTTIVVLPVSAATQTSTSFNSYGVSGHWTC